MNSQTHILNPETGRLIRIDSPVGRRIYKELKEVEAARPLPPPSDPHPDGLVDQMREMALGIASENKDKLSGLSEAETDALLRKLLVKRLIVGRKRGRPRKYPPETYELSEKTNKIAYPGAPVKKKKKTKFKLKPPEPSSSESDESESESESD